MSDGIIGKATYKCIHCGAKHYLHDEDFHFEAESGSERGMGEEVQYCYEMDDECHNCGNGIQLKFEVWEYPVGILNMTSEGKWGQACKVANLYWFLIMVRKLRIHYPGAFYQDCGTPM